MAEPGSHRYDIRRARLRDQLDNEGTPDRHATEAANKLLRGADPGPSAAMRTARAAGPAGERAEPPGDPGNVIPLRSPAFSDNAPMPSRLARDNGNEAPVLEWGDVPAGTAELVLLCLDPDAPSGPFLHWLVTGIAPRTRGYDPDAPVGTAHPNGYGERGYGGPLPPVGDDPHRYVFRLYALAEPCTLPADAAAAGLREWLDDRALATGTLTALYQR